MARTERERHRKLDESLDEALVETFPASDPVAVGHPTATERPGRPADRQAPLIDAEDVRKARRKARG